MAAYSLQNSGENEGPAAGTGNRISQCTSQFPLTRFLLFGFLRGKPPTPERGQAPDSERGHPTPRIPSGDTPHPDFYSPLM